MSWQRQALVWAALFLAFLGFVQLFSEILLPFLAGIILAYILDPLVDWLEALGLGRLASTITIIMGSVILLLLGLLIIIPLIGAQLTDFVQQLPTQIKRLQRFLVSEQMLDLTQFLQINGADLQSRLGDYVDEGGRWLTKILGSLLSGGQALFGLISFFIVSPVVAFYLLYDWDNMVAKIDDFLPLDHAETIRALAGEMSDIISGFLRAQGLVCAILALFYAVALTAIGLNFGLLIGIGIGLISFIPFIGAAFGFFLSMGIALAQFFPAQNFWMIGIVAAIFAAGQFLEGNILQPKILGDKVQLHPVWLMFALFAFGSLYGFVGMLIAVPTAACIGVLVRFLLARYKASELFLGAQNQRDGG